MKIILNKCYGGFGISERTKNLYAEKKDILPCVIKYWEELRNDETLIEILEEIREPDIEIVEIPDNSYWIIEDYDGYETLYYSESEIKEK